jgi:hypothetical protein
LAGVSPATFSNSGTVYSSNYAASDSFQATAPATNGFDGNITTRSACSSSGCTVTMTFSPALTVGTSLKIWSGYGVASVNGGTAVNFRQTSPRRQWQDLSFTGTLNTIVITGNDSGYGGDASAGECYAVEVDGCILVDGLAGKAIAREGDAAATNFNPFTTDIDAVRGQESGYCTLNPLHNNKVLNVDRSTLSDGNLVTSTGSNGNKEVSGTIGVSSGKWYFELTNVSGGNNTDGVGIADLSTGTEAIVRDDGAFRYNGSESSYSASWQTSGDVIGVKIDLDNSTIGFFKNGMYQGDAKTDLPSVTYHPYVYNRAGAPSASELHVNFGQKPFKFPPPEGFQPLNAANVRPDTVFARPDQYFRTTLYTGNAGTKTINVGLKPDLVWIKDRTDVGFHSWFDTVRGPTKVIFSNEVNLEETQSGVTAFNSDGFDLGSWSINNAARTYVAWTWKAGGDKNTFNVDDVGYASAAAAGLDGGTLNPTGASVGTKQGFSIIKYTGEGVAKTINHGMNKVPRFMLVKRTDANASWAVYHASAGNTKVYELNTGGTGSTSSTVWNSTTPTSSVFSIGDYADSGGDESDFIAYLWADVPGLQKFGKWTNNNSNDGTFTELGFRPAILLLKDIDGGEQWYIIDSKRQTFNIPAPSNNGADAVRTLQPSSPNSEATADNSHPNTTVDFLSNGFKIRSTNTGAGEISFGTRNYIYAAWAEAPVSNLYGAQSNAR